METTALTLSQIQQKYEQKRTELFKNVRLFWAFSKEQFEENKTKLEEGEKYVSIGCGGYLPNSQIKNFTDGFDSLNKQELKEIKQSKALIIEHIKIELSNYECYYTGDISNALAVLPYPKKQVLKIYQQERKKWAELDN